jgi:hypothetical protein
MRLEREAYLEERRALVNAEGEQARSYDKAILTLSAGPLGLSLIGVKAPSGVKLRPHKHRKTGSIAAKPTHA